MKGEERGLPLSGETFRQLFEDGPEPTVLLDENGRIRDLNRRFEEVFGYELEEAKGKGINSLIVPERLIEEAEDLDQKSKRGYLNYETVREGKEGEIPVSVSATPVTVEEGTYVMATYRDVTERKEAKERLKLTRRELKESKERYQRYFEELGDAIFVLKLGGANHGEILDANTTAVKQTGYSKEELIGMNIREDLVVKSPAMGYEEADDRLAKGETISFTEQKISKHGTPYWTEVVVTPIEYEGKEAALSINRDITERKRAQESLKKEREKLRQLHDAVDILQQQDTEEEVLQTAVEVAEKILDFHICAIGLVEGDYVIPNATSSGITPDDTTKFKLGEGITGKSVQQGRSIWGDDLRDYPEAKPTNPEFKAFISSPIGDLGNFQIVSKKVGSFTERDVELTEILADHLQEELQRVRLEKELREQAIRDPLTGLYNRRYFNEILQQEAEKCKRYDRSLAFVMMDVNRFKEINDHYSHQKGDRVLKEVANLLEENVRKADTLVRYGGDEFLVMIPYPDGKSENVITRLRDKLQKWNEQSNLLDSPLTLAMGMAHWSPDQNRDVEGALKEADKKMYEDKKDNS
ncbi:PAS domain S-box protein [Candidatus Bipolaricaulota bacterium]|nr:PAS domain S-box protein [Candidatus Bipolaricaulota bacterium]